DNIYISRSRSLCRRIINESEIKPILEEFNFTPLFLEDFSLDNQIQLFHFATRIIAPHGAGLANIMFCARGTQVMEIFEPTVTRHCYWSLATAKGLSYSCFMATTSAGFQPDPDILVNPRKLRNLLAQSPIGEIAVPHRPQFPNPEKSPPRATARHFS